MDELMKEFDEWMHLEGELQKKQPDYSLDEAYLFLQNTSKKSKNLEKIEIFQKSFLSTKTKNAPLHKQHNAACPEGRNFI